MSALPASRTAAVSRVYLIMALFIAIIVGFVVIIQVQMDALTAIRAYVGGEGQWAKAQRDAVRALEHYAASHDEADYRAFRQLIQVPLGDSQARVELQKAHPDLARVEEGFVRGRNHPDDVGAGVRFFRRFQHTRYMAKVIEHWTTGDRLIGELGEVATALHQEVASGQRRPEIVGALMVRLDDINQRVTAEEDLFSSTLSEASRWANVVSRNLTYAVAILFVVLGLALSRPIIGRIHATENALRESEERFRSIFERVDDIIYTVESDGTFSSISPSAARLLGWSPEEWMGRPYAGIVHPDDLSRMQELFAKALEGAPLPIFQVRLLAKAGGYLDAEIVANPIHRGGSIAVLGVVRDVTERVRKEKEIHRLASTDSLTGLVNRREFSAVLESELARARRYGAPLSLVMYDLDHFKKVNDTFGHDVGDQVLQAVTALVKRSIRATDVEARWGGEEFMILMPQTDLQAARTAAEKLRLAISGLGIGRVGSVTASFGVAEYTLLDNQDSLIRRVDDALYQAKDAGRDCVRIHGAEVASRSAGAG